MGLAGLERGYGTVLADPPWRFANRTGKMSPEHKRLRRYHTMTTDEIAAMPVAEHLADAAHCYLWCPNALLEDGLAVLASWGFKYKTNLVWYKVRKDGGPDGRGVGFYFRNVTELVLFGVRGRQRTLKAGRTQVNLLSTRKQEHSRKPDELYRIIEACSPGPYVELFARSRISGWTGWGDELDSYASPGARSDANDRATRDQVTRGLAASTSITSAPGCR
jgi:N6-adenosine-specific RNA methylase IME4